MTEPPMSEAKSKGGGDPDGCAGGAGVLPRGIDIYEWTAHPAKRRPQDVMLLAMVVLFSAWAVLVSLQSAFLAVLAVVILMFAVIPFYVPTRYRLDAEGVSERRLGRHKFRAWSDLRRVQIGAGAALVTPFARRSWLDRYRGVMLYLDGADRDRVLAMLRARIPRQAALTVGRPAGH
jgi:hypothetical protein